MNPFPMYIEKLSKTSVCFFQAVNSRGENVT